MACFAGRDEHFILALHPALIRPPATLTRSFPIHSARCGLSALPNSFRHSLNGSSLPSDGRRNIFCGTISQGSPECVRDNLGLNDSIPLGLVCLRCPKFEPLQRLPQTDAGLKFVGKLAGFVFRVRNQFLMAAVHHPIQIFQWNLADHVHH
jgi:hypothetical protein